MTWSPALLERNNEALLPMAQLTTMRIGGPAKVLTIDHLEDLGEALREQPCHFLGKGANLLVSDEPLRAPVLRLGKSFAQYQWLSEGDEALLRVGAAHDLALLIGRCCRDGYAGLEGLAGVPATVGGALCMNAGTAKHWIFDCLSRVQVLLPAATTAEWFDREQCQPQYRHSGFPAGTFFVACEFRLRRATAASLVATAKQLKAAKAASQPLSAASAGCIFKNPSPQLPAGRLIDELGLKGTVIGGAQISEQHGNFIINQGGALAHDVAALVRLIRGRARRERGIDLSLEVQRWELPDEIFEPTAEDV